MLEVININCGYQDKLILKDISFRVESSELLAVLGPNGSGKTTLLRSISRILKLKKGEILLDGIDIQTISGKDFARKVAVVSQNFEAEGITVEEFVLLGRIPYHKNFQFLETASDLEIAHKWMELTDTLRLKDQLLNEISGGERQLAQIARALTQEPQLLLLDEPTAHLDITYQAKILNLLKKLNKELNLTAIMVLHDLNLASEYCHRLILINLGKIDTIGTPQDIITKERIEKVYRTAVRIEKNSVSNKPYVFIHTE